ncbi:MAG: hypothetical protein WBO18_06850, partial [Gammaproteobacteria bacterium]
DGLEHADVAAWDAAEAEQLYHLLEDEVVPCFYRRDESGLPREWVGRMRESMACLTTYFSTNRMLREYVETYYLPLAEAYLRRVDGAASDLEDWSRQLRQHWARIHFGNVTSTLTERGHHFEVQVYLDELSPEAVRAELYADANEGGEAFRQPMDAETCLQGQPMPTSIMPPCLPTGRPRITQRASFPRIMRPKCRSMRILYYGTGNLLPGLFASCVC